MGRFSMQWIGYAILGYVFFVAILFLLQRNLLYPASSDGPPLELASARGFRVISTEPEPGLSPVRKRGTVT